MPKADPLKRPEAALRKFALTFPGSHEDHPWGETVVKVKGKIFVFLGEDGSPTPAYRMIDLYYPDYASVSAAVTTPEAGAFFQAMGRLSTGGVRVLVSDVEVPQR